MSWMDVQGKIYHCLECGASISRLSLTDDGLVHITDSSTPRYQQAERAPSPHVGSWMSHGHLSGSSYLKTDPQDRAETHQKRIRKTWPP